MLKHIAILSVIAAVSNSSLLAAESQSAGTSFKIIVSTHAGEAFWGPTTESLINASKTDVLTECERAGGKADLSTLIVSQDSTNCGTSDSYYLAGAAAVKCDFETNLNPSRDKILLRVRANEKFFGSIESLLKSTRNDLNQECSAMGGVVDTWNIETAQNVKHQGTAQYQAAAAAGLCVHP